MIIEITRWQSVNKKLKMLFVKKVQIKHLSTGEYGVALHFENGKCVILPNYKFTVQLWSFDNESTK